MSLAVRQLVRQAVISGAVAFSCMPFSLPEVAMKGIAAVWRNTSAAFKSNYEEMGWVMSREETAAEQKQNGATKGGERKRDRGGGEGGAKETVEEILDQDGRAHEEADLHVAGAQDGGGGRSHRWNFLQSHAIVMAEVRARWLVCPWYGESLALPGEDIQDVRYRRMLMLSAVKNGYEP